MTADWSPLRNELARWRQTGLDLPIWWRDDDAVEDTPALRKLTTLAARTGLPVHLAVVPKDASADLAGFCDDSPNLIPMVHGWAHMNHAPTGEKKAEFNHPRPTAVTELSQALVRLETLFGSRLLKVFVPPWNRISSQVTQVLAPSGFSGLSTFTPRKSQYAAPDLVQINTHLDPIHWRGGGGLRQEDAIIDDLVKLLEDRRAGVTDGTEPLGLLTHHLVHDDAIWTFTARCIAELLDGGARPVDLHAIRDALP